MPYFQKGFAPIIIILGILLVSAGIIGGAYYYKTTTEKSKVSEQKPATPKATPIPSQADETVNEAKPLSSGNWKTYTNSDFGISLEYPADAVVSTKTLYSMLSKSSNGLDIAPPYQEPYSKYYTFDLVVQDNPQNQDAKTIINNYIADIKKNCTPPACSTPKMITDTLKPYKNGEINGYIFHIGAETDSAMVVQVKSNKTYIFRMSGDQGNVSDYGLNIFDQILSAFNFLDKDISTERIVIKDDYWFEFNIPRGYRLDRNKIGSYLGYIVDEKGNKLLGFGFNSAGGELSPKGKTIIDGVPFTIEYDTEVSCSVAVYPTNLKFSLDRLYFFVSTWCKPGEEGKNISNKSLYTDVISSIKFSDKLKDILFGKTQPPLLKEID